MLCTNADTNRKTRKIFVPPTSNFCTASYFFVPFFLKMRFFRRGEKRLFVIKYLMNVNCKKAQKRKFSLL